MNPIVFRAGLAAAAALGTAAWQAYVRKASPFKVDLSRSAISGAVFDSSETPIKTPAPTLEFSDATEEAALLAEAESREKERRRISSLREHLLCLVEHNEFVFIDSNIWMDAAHKPALDQFQDHLVRRQARLRMLREQYEEIDRLKKSPESARQQNARFALRTIKEFTNKGALTFSYSLDKQAVRDVDNFVI